jgi:hypothetical protein
MAHLKELIALRDHLKAEGSLLTSGGIGAALVGAFVAPFILGPVGLAAGAYGLLKGRSGDNLDETIGVAIQEAFDAIFHEKPGTKGAVLQILLSLTDSNGKPIVCDLNRLSIITRLEVSTLTETIELLLKYSLIIKVSDSEETYTVHELVAHFVLSKLKEKVAKSDLQVEDK